MNPKDIKWKSEKYRKFIREMMCRFCDYPLLECGQNYEAHHHRHSGGKNPSDHLLIAMCLKCHNELHANESRFNQKHEMNDDNWLNSCLVNLINYVEKLNLNPRWICINALQKAAQENE